MTAPFPVVTSSTEGGAPESLRTMTPRKLNMDEDDEDLSLLQGGPFENTKRKCSWSASSMRKELGSPRMANSDAHSVAQAYAGFGLDGSIVLPEQQEREQQQQLQAMYSPPVPQKGEHGTSSNFRKKERSCTRTAGTTFLQELGSALVSCGAGPGDRDRARSSHPGSRSSSNSNGMSNTNGKNVMNVANSWVKLKDTFSKAVNGDLDAAKEAWRKDTPHSECIFADDGAINSVTSHDSIYTYDNYSVLNQRQAQQDEEAMQLRRLTSWGTVGTYETAETYGTSPTKSAPGAHRNANGVLEDDDGIPIDVHLLQTRGKKMAENAKSAKNKTETRRKRVVRFDYPPISSLRECPRTQPEQIEDLFFTEHELEQIEDDRYSTISADDVEIVAISTSATAESENCEDKSTGSSSNPQDNQNNDPLSVDENKNGNIMANSNNYSSTKLNKKDQRKGRRNTFSSLDDGRGNNNGTANNTNGKSRRRRPSSSDMANNKAATNPSATSPNASSRRMIKSVQIYLRERSVG